MWGYTPIPGEKSPYLDHPTFRQLLSRVREVTLNAYAHQDLPFEKVVEVLNPERDLSGMPLVRAKFDYQIAAGPPIDHAGLQLTELDVYGGMAKLDLLMNIEEIDQNLLCTLEYVTDLFEPATITQLLACYKALLAEITTNPDLPLTAYTTSINKLRRSMHQEKIRKLDDTNLQKLKNIRKR
jgi:non-ribosomal peptide synthetase component F